MEGPDALLHSNGMGYHWQGLYDVGLVENLVKFCSAEANVFLPQVKLCLLIGTYLSECYHGRMYAKAHDLHWVLRASYDRALQQVDWLCSHSNEGPLP